METRYEPSYWEQVHFRSPYDLVVIGAGLVGQSAALFYKQLNPAARVLVIERSFAPFGASTRNAGFTCIGSITELEADLETEEEDVLRKRIARRYKGLQLLRETLSDQAIGYQPVGGIEIFRDEDGFRCAFEHVDRFNAWIKEDVGARATFSNDTFFGKKVIMNRLEGAIHTGKMMRTLHSQCQKAGVDFLWGNEINHLELSANELTTNQNLHIRYHQCAVCTNAFTKTVLPNSRIVPGRGYVFVTRPLEVMKWKGTFHYDRGYIYFRNIGSDQILLGGARNVDEEGETTTAFGVNPSIKKHLIDFANEMLELEEGWEIEMEWSGIMGYTPTKEPFLSRVSEQVVAAVGLSGMGVALGMQLGKETCELLCD
ncbi:MAG: FAD-dependent oxidoreductase [Bacteroidota bacterium]